MAAIALLKFIQGLRVGDDGHALIVNAAVLTSIENGGDNTDVKSWRLELLFGPPSSTFEVLPDIPVLLAESNNGSVPASDITPQVGFYGCYRVRLIVWNEVDFQGVKDTDIRNICVLTPLSFTVLPPFQEAPEPLPTPGSGLPGEKPGELNFEGQPWGWSGPTFTGVYGQAFAQFRLMNAMLLHLDDGGGGGGGDVEEVQGVNGIDVVNGEGPVPIVDGLALYPIDGSRTAFEFNAGALPGGTSGLTISNSSAVQRLRVYYNEFFDVSLWESAVNSTFAAPRLGFSPALFGEDSMALDATTLATRADGYNLAYNASRDALDYVPGLPTDGDIDDILSYVPVPEQIQFPRRVSTVTGTDLWVPGDSGVLASGDVLYANVLSSDDEGATWTTNVDPIGAPWSPSFVVTDSATARSFMVLHDSNLLGIPSAAGIAEITSFTPLTLAAATPVDASPNGVFNDIADAIAPGDGNLYFVGQTSGGPPSIVQWDIVTGAAVDLVQHNNEPPQRIYIDTDVTKYGDGFGRLIWQTKNSGMGRCSLGNFSVVEEVTQSTTYLSPGGGGPYTATFGGIAIDGANNALYLVARSSVGQFHLSKTQLEPFMGTEDYNIQITGSDTSEYVGDVIFDPTTQRVFICYERQSENPSGWATSYIDVFLDTGSSFTLVTTLTIPDSFGGLSWQGSLVPSYYDPEFSLINNKVYLPMNGGRNNGAGPWDLLSNILQIDTVTPTIVNLGVTESAQWRDLTTGDLSWEPELTVSGIGGVPLSDPSDFAQFLGEGTVLRYSPNTSTWEYKYPRVGGSVSGDGDVTMQDRWDDLSIAKTDAVKGVFDLNINERSDAPTSGSEVHYDITLRDIRGTMGSSSTGGYMDITPANSRLIRGLSGDLSSTATFQMHSMFEHVQLTWDVFTFEWVCTGRYRPWEHGNVNSNITADIDGGRRMLAFFSNGTPGDTFLTLPGRTAATAAEHDDEVIICDIANRAGTNRLHLRSALSAVAGHPPNQYFPAIDVDNGFIHLKFNGPLGIWFIVGSDSSKTSAGVGGQTVELSDTQFVQGVVSGGGSLDLVLPEVLEGDTLTYRVKVKTLTGTVYDYYRAVIVVQRDGTSTLVNRFDPVSEFNNTEFNVTVADASDVITVTFNNTSGTDTDDTTITAAIETEDIPE